MSFFSKIFLKKNPAAIFLFVLTTVVGNLSYIIIMAQFSQDDSRVPHFLRLDQNDTVTVALLALIAAYGATFIISFIIQIYLANKFSVDLNTDMDHLLTLNIFREDAKTSHSLIIKDISNEFARFGNNIVLPLTEIVKNAVALVAILVALIVTEPSLLVPCLVLFVIYVLFWTFSRGLFDRISRRISELLLERQRLADYKYQNFDELKRNRDNSIVQEKFELAIREIARLNVFSKSVAITPRVAIEVIVLVSIVYFAAQMGDESVVLLGLAGLKLVVSTQGISNGVSNFQLNWPAFLEYGERRARYLSYFSLYQELSRNPFPKTLQATEISLESPRVTYVIPQEIKFVQEGVCLVRGPSGVGKSTFLNALAGFHKLASDPNMVVDFGSADASFLGQNTPILTGSVRENFDLHKNASISEERKRELYQVFFGSDDCDVLRLENDFKHFLGQNVGPNSGISGGEAKRVRMMTSLVSGARFFIWDEPFDGIHHDRTMRIVDYLKSLSGHTFLIIDHNQLAESDVSQIVRLKRIGGAFVEVKCD